MVVSQEVECEFDFGIKLKAESALLTMISKLILLQMSLISCFAGMHYK